MDTSAGALGDSVLNVAPKIKKERESTLLVFLPASVGKAGKQRSSELLVVVVVTLLLPMHVKAYKAL